MKLIAHRGNLNGPNPERENNPDYILEALAAGFDVEIDVWDISGVFMLGHDEPQYQVSEEFITAHAEGFWIHCKNVQALHTLSLNPTLNIFWHQNDAYTLTGHRFLWCYPTSEPTSNAVVVMPEWNDRPIPKTVYGVCTDFVFKYHKELSDKELVP